MTFSSVYGRGRQNSAYSLPGTISFTLKTAVGSADCADDADNPELGSDAPCTSKVKFSSGWVLAFPPFYLRNRRHLRMNEQPISGSPELRAPVALRQAVTDSMHGQEDAMGCGGVAELAAELDDDLIERAGRAVVPVSPDLVEEVIA